MSKATKIVLPVLLLFAAYAVYVVSPKDELGSFRQVQQAGEINQTIQVLIDKTKGFEKDRGNNIVAFTARDRENLEARIGLQEPAPAGLQQAEVVEIFGHMHGNNFLAKRITIVK